MKVLEINILIPRFHGSLVPMFLYLYDFYFNMADGGKKFCHNPPPHEGVWKWFYQAAQDIDWRAVGLTHVEYPVGTCLCRSYDRPS